ncbi:MULTISPECIES: GNAT family N-acetyltransferase [Myroides]|uniref:Protein ElaA n=1 Tax=Myroides albus TaxID=2562892 RepID=A0A6I3LIL7_9FLAO|nr:MULTISPECIES: GNAT family N-acetyltransferase [Myroides]MTG97664.1 GNAT family N-acetyltransferase [Myroides albus]MVX35663.1 GNAT family N-acetyltransferase [Myroides sp. LoEW2-1]UVD78790.1 GNAT family N-acetyltransferase [Myroides albus]
MNSIHWHTKLFDELTVNELYDILRLRTDIFVVEQNCPYPEIDGKDKQCLHIYATHQDKVIACARIVPPGLSYPEISIGRVAIAPDYRKDGYGRVLMQLAIEKIAQEFGEQDIQIGAQCYLKKFYGSFGFKPSSDDYLEDNIPHVDMIRSASEYSN